MSVRTYSGSEVQVLANGIPVNGWAPGTFVRITDTADRYAKVTGADGTTSRARVGDQSASVSVFLQQTSPSNGVFNGFLATDDVSGNGVFSLLIRDSSGNSLHFFPACWIRRNPETVYSQGIEAREWMIDTSRANNVHGGNPSQTGGS